MTVVYYISKYITFFGTAVKGMLEHITCGILKLFVEDARYLQPSEICGHVEHELPQSKTKSFLYSFIPTLINALLAFFLAGAGYLGLFTLGVTKDYPVFWFYIVLYYLGFSFFCNMFPTVEDAMNNWNLIYSSGSSEKDSANQETKAEKSKKVKKGKHSGLGKAADIAAKILLFIPSAIMYAGAYLERYCITFVIGIVVTVLGIVL